MGGRLPARDPLTPGAAEIRARYEVLLDRLRRAAEAAGRNPDGFRIVAVTKTWPVAVCRAALEAGLVALGENRVREALTKIEALPEVEWHLVGRLQSNKARRAVAAFAVVHSIDSVGLLERLDRLAVEGAGAPHLLLQVNVSGEPSKAGFAAEGLASEAAAALREVRRVRVVGLMTIAREGADRDEARRSFGRLRRLRDELQQAAGLALPELSMGMSGDAEAAVAEGATLVRIGTALFGERAG